jgi:diamine N-acetyltransferase
MNRFQIIEAHPKDVDELLQLSRKIFYDSFHDQNTPENMKAYMDMAYKRNQLLSELFNPLSEHYFICEDEKKIGFLKLNRSGAQSDLQDPESLELQRIYIDEQYQGRGLGAMLLQKAKDRARETQMNTIWLGVWEKNPDAIRFYQRHGFEIFGSHQFVMGDEVQTDILMKYNL